MVVLLPALMLLTTVHGASAPGAAAVRPWESPEAAVSPTRLDTLLRAGLRREGLEPARPCSDEVFCRRVHLDIAGVLPEPQDVERFLADRRPGKRAALIDTLLDRDEHAACWALKWCDVLRVKAEFPINLWPNAVQAYHRWIRDAVRTGMPYDRFARELLTSSGSNFRVPQVNFYRAVQSRQPAGLAAAAALSFMGTRVEHWPAGQRAGLEAFFSRVAYKKTGEWKEEIVLPDPEPAGPLHAVLPDGRAVTIPPDRDPRVVFADWLITPENPWFARQAVNRLWCWLLGRGLIHEPDDIRPDNPPVHPEVLAFLEKELVRSGWDLRHVMRLILNSATYQQACIPRGDPGRAERLFASYPIHPLGAEVLIDALCRIAGEGEAYSSPIPEPFTFIPDHQPTIELADGSITSPFLELFGRPARDTGLESERGTQPTVAQRLHLLNSSHVRKKIEGSRRLAGLQATARGDGRRLVRSVYLLILSREPMPEESAAAVDHLRAEGPGLRQSVHDLAWALINSKEFLYRH